MKLISPRQSRVAEEVKHLISRVIVDGLEDPRVAPLTVSDVEVSADLRVAHVYVAIFDKEKKEMTLEGLNSAVPFFRRIIASELNLKFTPDLKFKYDESLERGARIESLLSSIRNKE